MKQLRFFLPILFLFIVSLVFFYPVILQGKIPIAADTIVGLYHPYRDFYTESYPNGIPFKNFLITDPVRQQFPWRLLSIETLKLGSLPLWNPYNGAGSPLLANFQAGSFYPLNIIYFILPFVASWSILVMLQILLAGLFMYLYLRYMKLHEIAAVMGALAFSFSGFAISWLEWNTILQTVMWVPLVLFAKEHFLKDRELKWLYLSIFSECALILAGHLQAVFYSLLIINLYLFVRVVQFVKRGPSKNYVTEFLKTYKPFLIIGVVTLIITSIQWIPTLQLILHSARDVDQANWQTEGWFLPWQNLVQFIAPDFFGNPATLNYYGVWNYAEFIGYIGIIPFLMALYSLFFRRDRKTVFFAALFFFSLLFSLPTFFAKLPYIFSIPFLSSAQPTRLLLVTDFSLSILAALGFDLFLRQKKKIIYPVLVLAFAICVLWAVTFFFFRDFGMSQEQAIISRNNLKLPTILFAAGASLLSAMFFIKKRYSRQMILLLLIFLCVFDFLRFAWKFTPFVQPAYLFPTTKTLHFLQDDTALFRIMAADSRILPPNFSSVYHLETVDLYDPLYPRRYGEFIAAIERDEPNISPPFGFNRIITPHNILSPFINLLNVKYILSFSDIGSPRFKKVFQEGKTIVFENKEAMPRFFFVKNIVMASNKADAINKLFLNKSRLLSTAVVEDISLGNKLVNLSSGNISLVSYRNNEVVIKTSTPEDAFFVVLDANFPSWHAYISSGSLTKEVRIYQTDFVFRGVFTPKGEHVVTFRANLL